MALTEKDLKEIPETGINPGNPGKYQEFLEDLQGNILKGHGRDYSVHLFLKWKLEQVKKAKQWIKNFAQTYVTSAKQQADEALKYRTQKITGSVFANIFFTRKGYQALGFGAIQIPKDQPFTMGMKHEQIRDSLGDPEVEEWEEGFQQEIHALILIADDVPDTLSKTVDEIKRELCDVAVIIHQQDGFVLRNEAGQVIEHFGFVDGVSQPLFLQGDIEKAQTKDCNFSLWDPRAPLEIIVVKDPNGKRDDSYGSYLVYRKLEQNVQGFRGDQQKLAHQLSINNDLAGALVVGRFADGTPVTESDVPTCCGTPPTNNFNYDADFPATKCPFHAHIRKTNPRGDTGKVESSPGCDEALAMERNHRIARRAISYGENDPNQTPETGSGLLFLCFQANTENQFNFIQARWSNPDRFVQVGVGPDPLIGQPEGTQKWPKQWGGTETEDYDFKLWVSMKGGEYFFAPSLSFLTCLV
ncbi:MAG: Dyp-type peroxidase [Symploca sp. SIO2E9]|nr:Dyp-type peroxidase [Symploca sp. SIO2E9]